MYYRNPSHKYQALTVSLTISEEMAAPSEAGSALDIHGSQSLQSLQKKKLKSNRHLTLAEIRGIIPVWKYHFDRRTVNGHKKNWTKTENDAKWEVYKRKMRTEFGRAMKGQQASEKKFIDRHTLPLAYLRYRQPQLRPMDPTKLTETQFEYYMEIGGKRKLEDLIREQNNIDSVEKADKRCSRRRKRHHSDLENDDAHSNTGASSPTDSLSIISGMPASLSMPGLDSSQSGHPKVESNQARDAALDQLHGGLNKFERELLEKKKVETFELFQQKLSAVSHHVQLQLKLQPELIGCMMGAGSLEDQLNVAFDFWVSQHVDQIKQKTGDLETFVNQVSAERHQDDQWLRFLTKWKLRRIAKGNTFQVSWDLIVTELNIEEDTIPEQNQNLSLHESQNLSVNESQVMSIE